MGRWWAVDGQLIRSYSAGLIRASENMSIGSEPSAPMPMAGGGGAAGGGAGAALLKPSKSSPPPPACPYPGCVAS